MKFIGKWPCQKGPWVVLFLTALALIASALYFQYELELAPCIKCIYQRTAVIGVLLSALLGILLCRYTIPRLLALAGWMASSAWGAWVAYEHVEIQDDPFGAFVGCEFMPRFPDWAPLHEWWPEVFAATGSCGDIDWQFAGLSMPQWMLVIFSSYLLSALTVTLIRWVGLRKL